MASIETTGYKRSVSSRIRRALSVCFREIRRDDDDDRVERRGCAPVADRHLLVRGEISVKTRTKTKRAGPRSAARWQLLISNTSRAATARDYTTRWTFGVRGVPAPTVCGRPIRRSRQDAHCSTYPQIAFSRSTRARFSDLSAERNRSQRVAASAMRSVRLRERRWSSLSPRRESQATEWIERARAACRAFKP
jgi:hypothetical protein